MFTRYFYPGNTGLNDATCAQESSKLGRHFVMIAYKATGKGCILNVSCTDTPINGNTIPPLLHSPVLASHRLRLCLAPSPCLTAYTSHVASVDPSGEKAMKDVRAAVCGSDADGRVKSVEASAMWTASPLHHASRSPEGEKQKHCRGGRRQIMIFRLQFRVAYRYTQYGL